ALPGVVLARAAAVRRARYGRMGRRARHRTARAARDARRSGGDRRDRTCGLRRDVAHPPEARVRTRGGARADRSRSRGRTVSAPRAAVAAVIAAAFVIAGPLTAATSAADDRSPVQRVLLISLPAVTWADLASGNAPHLEALLSRSAVGDLVTRAAG